MIKVGICGAGFMGKMHATCYAAVPGVKVVAVADKRRAFATELAGAHDAATFADARQLITKAPVDMVSICLPTHMHCAHVLLAARRGIHCFCEKPISRTLTEAGRMLRAARSAKIKFMVGHVIRFWPEYQVLKKYVDEKRLGQPHAFSFRRRAARRLESESWKDWCNKPLLSGGAFLDMHIHDTDYIRYLFGEPASVNSNGVAHRRQWDYVLTYYRYPEVAVSAEAAWTAGEPFEMAFHAAFEKGTLVYSSRHEPLTLYRPGRKPFRVRVPNPRVENVKVGGNISDLGGYYNEIRYFVQCVKKGREPEITTPQDARKSLALVFEEMASARKKLKR